ncbi:MAG: hypothetical protein ETSY1_34460 [Candidatus Entotheonella factor]|uniref:Uncharacterized protein n=1 Tax=Entotheonella factor TaxID=1429438 RepID=W4L916_ENTF1|nr:MAG: hypothetical protein ETSY1_34460 [Candidatus Entotheonella factor]
MIEVSQRMNSIAWHVFKNDLSDQDGLPTWDEKTRSTI